MTDILATLMTNGFDIHKVNRVSPGNTVLSAYKYDRLGAAVRYSLLFTDDSSETAALTLLIKTAKSDQSTPLCIAEHLKTSRCKCYTPREFFDFFGGLVDTGLTLLPNIREFLIKLGNNSLPNGLQGAPDELFEIYTMESLRYLLASPSRRYGSDRLFQSLPDGLVLGKARLNLLVDDKAYTKGFKVKADDIKRFATYAQDYNNRYSHLFGRAHSVVVVTSTLLDSPATMAKRSEELYSQAQCKLNFLTSDDLGAMIELTRQKPDARFSIDWHRVFAQTEVKVATLKAELKRIDKDKLA